MAQPSPQNQQNQPQVTHEILQFYLSVPQITRFLLTSCLVISLLGNFFVHPKFFVLFLPFLKKFELWRLFTCFFFSKFSFNFVFMMMFMYNQSKALETGYFQGKPADYVLALTVIMGTLVAIGILFESAVLLTPLIYAIVYLFSLANSTQIIQFLFGINVKAQYFPFVLLAFDLLTNSFDIVNVGGFFASHLYWYFKEIYPVLKTPEALEKFFPEQEVAMAGVGGVQLKDGAKPQKYQWGKGRKLGS